MIKESQFVCALDKNAGFFLTSLNDGDNGRLREVAEFLEIPVCQFGQIDEVVEVEYEFDSVGTLDWGNDDLRVIKMIPFVEESLFERQFQKGYTETLLSLAGYVWRSANDIRVLCKNLQEGWTDEELRWEHFCLLETKRRFQKLMESGEITEKDREKFLRK